MSIREKYKIEETASAFSLQPQRFLVTTLWYNIVGMIACGIILLLFFNRLSEGVRILLVALMLYCVGYVFYTVLFRLSVRYSFDKASNSVLKRSLFSAEKKIMRLDEAVIFQSSEPGRWHYSLGVKRAHFIKSHVISEYFSSGKNSERRQKEYEEVVLNRIEKMIS